MTCPHRVVHSGCWFTVGLNMPPTCSDVDALDLVERDLFLQPIVELGGAGGLVPRDPGRNLEVAAVSKVLGDPGSAEAVGADLDR